MMVLKENQTKVVAINLAGEEKLEILLAGENARVEVVGLVLGKDREQKALEAYITHAAPNTKSNIQIKGVLKNFSKFDFRGMVKIEKGAKGSDAYLRSDVLLFDEAQMGDDTPALEILEPDVKAGHAATIGKIDEKMIFYLMSRGISRKKAENLLIEGFIDPIMEKIRNPKPEIRNGSEHSGNSVIRKISMYSDQNVRKKNLIFLAFCDIPIV